MSEEEALATFRDIGARLFALQAGLMAVIKTHPNPQALAAALAVTEDAGVSNMLYAWEESHLDVYRNVVRQLRDQIPPG